MAITAEVSDTVAAFISKDNNNSCEVAESFKKTRIIPRPVSSFANTVACL